MKIAVTNHAVDRFVERAEGVKGFDTASVRAMIRKIVEDGFREGAVRSHPQEKDRRIIPFASGASILYLSIGKNTTTFPGDIAVIGVLFEKELTEGRIGTGATLGDKFPRLSVLEVAPSRPRFKVFIGDEDTIESYHLDTEEELETLLARRQPEPGTVAVYKLWEKPRA